MRVWDVQGEEADFVFARIGCSEGELALGTTGLGDDAMIQIELFVDGDANTLK